MKAEILIIGAGPAGLGAAIEAAKLGAKVILLDENEKAGGQLFKQIHKFFGSKQHYAGVRGFQIGEDLLKEAESLGVEVLLDARAVGMMDNGSVAVLHKDELMQVEAKKIVLATGARENAISFPGWTLPGVMTAGAAQTFSNVHGTLVGKNILMVGTGNVGLIVSYQLMQAGANVKGLVEVIPRVSGYGVHAGKIKRAGVPIWTSHTVIEARGKDRVEEAVIAQVDEKFQPIAGTERIIKVDTILLAVGLTPKVELAKMAGCALAVEPTLGGHLPYHNDEMLSTNPSIYVCGDIAGVEEANTALDEGRLAGLSAARELGYGDDSVEDRKKELNAGLCALRMGTFGEKRLECKERIMKEWSW
jgi:thioredoxin reductase